jgi:3-oxoacyl-[acyl-carrier-protein] synthase III
MSGITIQGTGMYIPEKLVTNDDMAKIVETSDEWISERTGIRERRFSEGEPNYYMGKEAALQALDRAGVNPAEIDLIIAGTTTPDYYFPALSCLVQGEIGAENAFCWDLSAACSGFIYALDVAQAYLSAGKAKTVLIVCSEVLSKITDFTDRTTCVLFGDGAGAVVVKAGNGIYESCLRSEGKSGGAIVCRALKNESPFAVNAAQYPEIRELKEHYLRMEGREVYRFATKALTETVETACAKAGVKVSDLSLLVPHQANLRIIHTAVEKLGIGMDKVYVNIDRYGNTSCASIPICLEELNAAGRLHRGDLVAMAGFGAGLTCGASVFEW